MAESSPFAPPPPQPAHARGWRADLHLAAVFLTRLPLPDPGAVPPGGLAAAMRAFPLVGAGLGLAAGGLAVLLPLPPLPAALIAVLALILVTGALHEDGLADLADGLGARGDRDRRLAAMRESHVGAYGVLALIFSVGLRVGALAALPPSAAIGAMVAALAVSRALIPAAMRLLPPARPDGLATLAGHPAPATITTALVLGGGIAVAALGPAAVPAAIAAAVAMLAVLHLARRHLGGYTGDVLGAVAQTAEITLLLTATAILT